MEFLGLAKLIFLMTFSAPGNMFEPPQTPPAGKTCLPDVTCTLLVYYHGPGDVQQCRYDGSAPGYFVTNKPSVMWFSGTPAGADNTYVLFMADPDAPDPCNENGFLFHWVAEATFVEEKKPMTYVGQDLLPYSPPSLSEGSKAHRFQVMMYKVKKTAIAALNDPLAEYAKSRLPGTPVSKFLSPLGLKNDEPPVATTQFCFSRNIRTLTCLEIKPSPTTQGPSTTMSDGGPPQASTISTNSTTSTNATNTQPPTADSTIVRSVFQETTLVLVYSVVLGWMNS